MTFSAEWDQRYLEGTHLSVWPWSDLVSLVRRNFRNLGAATRVLELGCGAGANIPFFLSLGVQYFAMDGSPAIVATLRERFPSAADRIAVADFTLEAPFPGGFDIVVDRAAVTHNSSAAIERAMDLVWHGLVPGGSFVGVDWFSTRYGEFGRGLRGDDAMTRTGYRNGPFAGTGNVHFSDEAHLRALFHRFELAVLEEKIVRNVVPGDSSEFATWNIVARKPDA